MSVYQNTRLSFVRALESLNRPFETLGRVFEGFNRKLKAGELEKLGRMFVL